MERLIANYGYKHPIIATCGTRPLPIEILIEIRKMPFYFFQKRRLLYVTDATVYLRLLIHKVDTFSITIWGHNAVNRFRKCLKHFPPGVRGEMIAADRYPVQRSYQPVPLNLPQKCCSINLRRASLLAPCTAPTRVPTKSSQNLSQRIISTIFLCDIWSFPNLHIHPNLNGIFISWRYMEMWLLWR